MAGILTACIPVVQVNQVIMEGVAAPGSRPAVLEIATMGNITGAMFGVGRSSSPGVQPLGNWFATNDDTDESEGPAGSTKFYTAWKVREPGLPTAYFRRCYPFNSSGCGFIWTFPRGLIFNSNANLVTVNISAVVGLSNHWWVINE
jgi:hypothetical protein